MLGRRHLPGTVVVTINTSMVTFSLFLVPLVTHCLLVCSPTRPIPGGGGETCAETAMTVIFGKVFHPRNYSNYFFFVSSRCYILFLSPNTLHVNGLV